MVGIIDRSVSEKAVGHNLADVAVEEYMDMDFETLTTNDTLYKAVGSYYPAHMRTYIPWQCNGYN